MEWISEVDNQYSNKFICGSYVIRYQDSEYGYQYFVYYRGKQIDSCQTLDGAKRKAEAHYIAHE